jgi:DNA-binding MarR family transcriptional regulator
VGPVSEPPVPLARLFAMGYRMLVDALHEELPRRGWSDVRPAFGFVLLALRDSPAALRDLPGALGTSKQAVSKLVDAMVAAGYVDRTTDPDDARAKRLSLSDRGRRLLAVVEEIYAELERDWAAALGAERLTELRQDLTAVLSAAAGGRLPAVRSIG